MTGHKDQDESRQIPSPQPEKPLAPAHEWLKPSPAYIMPSSGFFFGIGGQGGASLIDFLPSRLAADRLIKQYFGFVHPICKILHRPTFEKEYDSFWDEVSLGIEPPNSVQTIVFAAMFSAVVSMDESTIIRDFGVSKSSMIGKFPTYSAFITNIYKITSNLALKLLWLEPTSSELRKSKLFKPL